MTFWSNDSLTSLVRHRSSPPPCVHIGQRSDILGFAGGQRFPLAPVMIQAPLGLNQLAIAGPLDLFGITAVVQEDKIRSLAV